jgi:hypothetical protein
MRHIRPDSKQNGAVQENIRPDMGRIRPDMGHIRPYMGHIRPVQGNIRPDIWVIGADLGAVEADNANNGKHLTMHKAKIKT